MKTFFELRESVQEKTLTPAEKKKREEIAQAMERDNPDMPMDKKMAIATAQAKKVAEGYRVHAMSKDGEKMKSGIHSTAKAAHDMHYKMAKSGMYKKIEVVKETTDLQEVSNAVKDQLANIDLSIRDWERRWKNKSTNNPNDMKAPQKIKDLKAQKAALMKKHGIKEGINEISQKAKDEYVKKSHGSWSHMSAIARDSGTPDDQKARLRKKMKDRNRGMSRAMGEEVDLDEGKKGVVLGFKDQYKSRAGATDDGQRQMKKLGGSSFSVYQSSNGLWAYKIFEGVEDLDEKAPKIKPDFLKVQRAKDNAHDAAMGRTKTGRKKPERAMTSTQRSMASMNKEEVELDEGISNLSHSRLKYHATKGVSHGSYSTAEIKDEHKRRLRSEPDYVKAKASMNEGIKAKPDATEVIRKKKQMAAISTSDKDKLSKIAQMMARANEGLK